MDSTPKSRNPNRSFKTWSNNEGIVTEPFSRKHKTLIGEGIEYNRKISMDQVIEYKKRERKQSMKPVSKTTEKVVPQINPFTEEFYEGIETFLDEHAVFIVEPEPVMKPLTLAVVCSLTKIKDEEESELPTCLLKRNCQDDDTLELNKLNSLKVQASRSGPFLRAVGASALAQRRKKFETIDCVRQRNDV